MVSGARWVLALMVLAGGAATAIARTLHLDAIPKLGLFVLKQTDGVMVIQADGASASKLKARDHISLVEGHAATVAALRAAADAVALGAVVHLRVTSGTQAARTVELVVTEPPPEDSFADHWLGKAAPPFEAKVTSGPPLASLQSLRGGWVVLDFWSIACKPCVQSLPLLRKAEAKLRGRVRFVSLSSDDMLTQQKAAQRYKLAHTMVLDEDDAIQTHYGLTGIPVLLVVDPTGIVRHAEFGGPTPASTWAQIEKLVDATPASKTEVP